MKITKVLTIAAAMTAAAMMMSCAGLAAIEEGDGAARTTYNVTSESALKSAVSNAKAGDTINLGANIKLTSTLQLLKSGTSSSKINFNGCGKTLDCSGISSGWGVKCNGSYWNICNMTIKNAPDCGIVFQSGGYNYVYYVKTLNNKDSGLQIYNSSHDNYIYKCESYYNYDTQNGGENADGYACKLSGGKNNKFEGCIAAYNSDDGWDLYGQPYSVYFVNCEAKYNGYTQSGGTTANGDGNGFKLGKSGQSVVHYLSGCNAHHNLASGYDGNGNTAKMSVTNCSSSNNKKYQWYRITGISNK